MNNVFLFDSDSKDSSTSLEFLLLLLILNSFLGFDIVNNLSTEFFSLFKSVTLVSFVSQF